MSDTISPKKRSWNMSRIRDKDTSIEVKVRKYLFSKGYRFRKNDKRFPGKPDIVLPKYKTVIFIQGCFWHQHPGCKRATMPKSRTDYWLNKLSHNVEKDRQNTATLSSNGWNVITIWECEINKHFDETMEKVIMSIPNDNGGES